MTVPDPRPDPCPDTGPGSKARLRLWLKLLKTTRTLESGLRENLRTEFASTLPRFDVMSALARNAGGLKMSELSGLLKVSNGNVTGIVERLVEDGHVLREPVPGDRRANRVRLTRKGKEEFTRQAARHETWVDRFLSALDADEAGAMTATLDRILTEGRS
ncbi:MarR family winged helix-turn-helix transcriptional regulator [Pukyongiella litopenaei]|uniref:MarR family transcriptional regulator n=1 Tax=Pukyongiella litopenaei TaxID=2605946 RepID=A0A2S0MMS4_9RHOB|nr:MarR family transcriptional regulator [Pukyongiella litopenaei]AVO37127.1 MarR family transcriptional regulator [Pukyongiella litopenaei]